MIFKEGLRSGWLKWLVLIPIAFFTFSSCTIRSSDKTSSGGLQPTRIYVKVLDYNGDTPIEQATVRIFIDSNGNNMLEEKEALSPLSTEQQGNTPYIELTTGKKVKVIVQAPGYATFYRVYDSVEQIPPVIRLFKAERVYLAGNEVNTNEVQIHIGNAQELGIVQADVSQINVGQSSENMPGGFEGIGSNGERVLLSSGGVLQVEFYDQQGFPNKLPEGNYPIFFKIHPANYAGLDDFNPETEEVEIPLWYFDEKTGIWREYPTQGVLVDSQRNAIKRAELSDIISGRVQKDVYVMGSITHFSIINLDYPSRRGQLCGEVQNAPEGSYIFAQGLNYNGSTPASPIDKDGKFCIGVPRNNENKPYSSGTPANAEECRDAHRKLISDILYWMDFYSRNHENSTCRELWKEAADTFSASVLTQARAIREAAKGTQDYERINQLVNQMETQAKYGFYNQMADTMKTLSRVYGAGASQISADNYLKAVTEMEKSILKNGLEAISGIAVEKLSDYTVEDLTKGMNSDECRTFVSSTTLSYVSSTLYKGGVSATFTIAESLKGEDVSVSEFLNGILVGMFWDALSTPGMSIIEKDGSINKGFLDCMRKLMPSVANSPNVLRSLAKKASLVATALDFGVKSYLDIKEAQQNIAEMGLTDLAYTSGMLAGANLYNQVFKKLKNANCLGATDPSSGLSSVPRQCREMEFKREEFIKYFTGQPLVRPQSTTLMKKKTVVTKTTEVEDPFEHYIASLLSVAINRFILDQLSYTNYDNPKNVKWYDRSNSQILEGVPTRGSVVGNPYEYGGYVSKLFLVVNGKRLPLSSYTSEGYFTNFMPSPGGDFALWIGRVDVKDIVMKEETLTVDLTINAPQASGFSIKEVLGVYLKDPDMYEVFKVDNFSCNVSGTQARCTLKVPKIYSSSRVRMIDLKFVAYGKEEVISLPFDERLSSNTVLNKNLVECDRMGVVDFNVPEVIEANNVYTARVRAETVKYLADSCREREGETNIESIKWFMSSVYLGEGESIEFRTPDKKSLLRMGNEILIGVHLCSNGNCITRTKTVKVNVQNSAPEILSIGMDDRIGSQIKEFRPQVSVVDRDGDDYSLSWSVSDDSLLIPGEVFKVNHLTVDRRVRVCLTATDGIASSVKCQDVVVERAITKPEVLAVKYQVSNFVVPTKARFLIDYASNRPVETITVTDNFGRRHVFKERSFEIDIPERGSYQFQFSVTDDSGQSSEPYTVSMSFYGSVNISVDGRISSLRENEVEISLTTSVNSEEALTVYRYLIDFNLDGYYEVSLPAESTSLVVAIPIDLSSVRFGIDTDRGVFYTQMQLSTMEPFVKLTANPSNGQPPLTVAFNVQAFAFGTTPIEYRYDFNGDGVVDERIPQSTTSYTYQASGTYSPSVNVLFQNGTTGGSSTVVSVFGVPQIEVSGYGTAISGDGKIIAGVRQYQSGARAHVWKIKANASLGPINFLEDATKFDAIALEVPSDSGVLSYTTGMSSEGSCIAGVVNSPSNNRPVAWILDQNTYKLVQLQTNCTSGNTAYECEVIGGSYTIVGRTCPDFPYATIWQGNSIDNISIVYRNSMSCYGILHSVSANGVISGSNCWSGFMWDRTQENNPIVYSEVYSRYHSVISEDGLVAAFHNDFDGSMRVVRKIADTTRKSIRVNNYMPYAVVNEGNERFAVYGTSGGKASKILIDFSGDTPVAGQVEDLNNTFRSIIPSDVTLTEIRAASPDGRYLLCTAQVGDKRTPCLIDTSLHRQLSTSRVSISQEMNPTSSTYGGCSISTGLNFANVLLLLSVYMTVLIRRILKKFS